MIALVRWWNMAIGRGKANSGFTPTLYVVCSARSASSDTLLSLMVSALSAYLRKCFQWCLASAYARYCGVDTKSSPSKPADLCVSRFGTLGLGFFPSPMRLVCSIHGVCQRLGHTIASLTLV